MPWLLGDEMHQNVNRDSPCTWSALMMVACLTHCWIVESVWTSPFGKSEKGTSSQIGASWGISSPPLDLWHEKIYLVILDNSFNILRLAVAALMRTASNVPQGSIDAVLLGTDPYPETFGQFRLQGISSPFILFLIKERKGRLHDASV